VAKPFSPFGFGYLTLFRVLNFVICHCPRKEIATPQQVGVHNDKEAILSMQASSPEGHSTIFYCKTVLIGDSHEPGWLVC